MCNFYQRVPQLLAVFDQVIRYKLLKSRWMESDLRLEPRYGADFCRYGRKLLKYTILHILKKCSKKQYLLPLKTKENYGTPKYFFIKQRVVVYTSYMDDEKKQVLQLYGQRSYEATSRNANILCDIPGDIENPSILVTGKTL